MGHAFQSPLRRWDVVAGLCQSINARTFVEVGCKDGRTTGVVLEQCPQIQVIAIDPWRKQPKGDDLARETYEDWNFEEIEKQFWQNVGANKDRCEMWRVRGIAAAETFRARLADVVFIDALHDYGSVCVDIMCWWPLLREGGFLCGHDYNHKWPGVMRAVAHYFPLLQVGVCPDSVWFVQKSADLQLRAAA
jgi:hypothetical protein